MSVLQQSGTYQLDCICLILIIDKHTFFFLFIRNWLSTAKTLCTSDESVEFSLEKVGDEIAKLEKELSGKDEITAFCHNDLQYGNIMMDEETGLVTLIVSLFCNKLLV